MTARADRPLGAQHDDVFAGLALEQLPAIFRIALALTRDRVDAEDLVQETYVRAFQHWTTFTPGSDCRRWLGAICRHTYFAQHTRARWVTAVGDDLELETFAAIHVHKTARDHGLDDVFTRVDLGPAIRTAIEALPSVFREVVQLIDVEDLTYEETASSLGIPVGTVRSRLYRARRQLQERLIEFARDAGFGSAAPRIPPTAE